MTLLSPPDKLTPFTVMLLTRVFITYLARELTRRLADSSLEVKDAGPLQERFETILVDELSLEDEINTQVREL